MDRQCTWPWADGPRLRQATWAGLEQAVEQKLARSIGVSNFKVAELQAVLATATTLPAVRGPKGKRRGALVMRGERES